MSETVQALMRQLPILPGEYLPGYLSRLRHMLFYVDSRDFFSVTNGVQLGKLDKLLPKAALRFVYLNMAQGKRGKTLHQHLAARYWRGFVSETFLNSHVEKELLSTKSRRSIFKGEELLGDLSKPKFCSSCMNSDIERFGVALWRAEHQLPSVFVCPEHNEPLKFFAINPLMTMLDFPSPQDVPSENAVNLNVTPVHKEVTAKSLYLLNHKTEVNRILLRELRDELRILLKANVVAGRPMVNRGIVQEWLRFLNLAISSVESIQQRSSNLQNLSRFHPNEIISDESLIHPIMFILLLQFAEMYSGKRTL